MATSEARGAAAWRARAVPAARLLLLAAGVAYCFFVNLSGAGAVAAAYSVLRAAASFAARQYAFVGANAIVLVLLALFIRDDEAFSFSAAAFFGGWWPSADGGDAHDDRCRLPSPEGPPLMLMLPPPPEAAAVEEEAVFEDKEAVHVTTVARAQPPRRSKSEKAGGRGGGAAAGRRLEAAPELRRAESENGRQAAPPEVLPVEWDLDGEAFQRYIDAYILKKQTQFQYEESDAAAKAAAAAGAVVAVK